MTDRHTLENGRARADPNVVAYPHGPRLLNTGNLVEVSVSDEHVPRNGTIRTDDDSRCSNDLRIAIDKCTLPHLDQCSRILKRESHSREDTHSSRYQQSRTAGNFQDREAIESRERMKIRPAPERYDSRAHHSQRPTNCIARSRSHRTRPTLRPARRRLTARGTALIHHRA